MFNHHQSEGQASCAISSKKPVHMLARHGCQETTGTAPKQIIALACSHPYILLTTGELRHKASCGHLVAPLPLRDGELEPGEGHDKSRARGCWEQSAPHPRPTIYKSARALSSPPNSTQAQSRSGRSRVSCHLSSVFTEMYL